MAGVTRRALPQSPAAEAITLAERMLAAGNDAAGRQAVVAARTASASEEDVRRLLVSTTGLSAWCVLALARCRGQRPAEVVAQLRELAGGSS